MQMSSLKNVCQITTKPSMVNVVRSNSNANLVNVSQSIICAMETKVFYRLNINFSDKTDDDSVCRMSRCVG